MKTVFWTIALAASLLSCGSRTANSAPIFELVGSETVGMLEAPEEGDAVFDKLVHDFGDISATDGPQSCTFTLTNTGQEPIVIFEVVSTCGCTNVEWTREPLQPGQSGSISATYKNEDGPTAFDKTLTVYISGIKKPVVLRLRGVVHEQKKSLSELYGEQQLGAFGIKDRHLKTSNLRQGQSTSETVYVANLSKSPIKIGFTGVAPQLKLDVDPNPIPAQSIATLSFTVTSDPALYGKNIYEATPVIDGKKAIAPLQVTTWTLADFSTAGPEERENGPIPVFEASTFNFDVVEAGKAVEAVFTCRNTGASPFHVYKIDTENPALYVLEPLPDLEPGNKGSVRFKLDTSRLPKGETVIMISLTTNSPLRPLINLFVAGEIR